MSATRGNGEHWKSLESVGISRKELALAEALQMEYDALSRLRQDKEESQAKQNTEQPLISWDDPILDYNKPAVRNDCHNIKVMRGLSGSDPTLNYNGEEVSRALETNDTTSSSLLPEPENQPWLKEPLSSDYLYIFDSTGRDFLTDPLNSTSCHNSGGSISPKKLSPPPLPPRIAVWNASEVNQASLKGSQPNDINMFSSAHERADGKLLGRRISEEDPYSTVDYDGINDAITRLNLKSTYDTDLLREAAWSWKEGRSIFEKESSGKPVARSKTMPPQVPPRTYVSRSGGRKNGGPNKNRRISADPVTSRHRPMTNGYELFEVSEEKDEEVAAFCHMLDVLRSGYSTNDYTLTGYVWSTVNLGPEHLGHGISLKVTVVYDSLQEPLTFTCDCSSTVDLLIYQTLCYTHDELRDIDVDDFVLKLCGLEEFLQKECWSVERTKPTAAGVTEEE